MFSATPAARARRLCPQAVFVPPDFEHYRARSREVMDVLRAHVERVEVVGLDEAYLDLSRPGAARRRPRGGSRRRCSEATGLCCSIGIGPNKLVAKVASDADKPNGFVVLTAGRGARALRRRQSPGLIPGIGPKTVERLRQRGHRDARASSRERPTHGWPSGSAHGWAAPGRLARFEDERELELDRGAQVGVARDDIRPGPARAGRAEPVLERLSEQLCADLARHERRGRTIGIKVRLDDFSTHTRARSVAAAVNDLRHRPRAWRASCCRSSTRRGRCGCSACGWRASTRPPPLRAIRCARSQL